MRMLLYAKEGNESGEKWEDLLQSNFKDSRVETFRTAHDLTLRLREPSEETRIVILRIDDQEDIKHFVSIQPLFLNVPLIIQVPDDSEETLNMVHRLRPRYLNSAQDDFGALISVVRKILGNPQEFSGGPG